MSVEVELAELKSRVGNIEKRFDSLEQRVEDDEKMVTEIDKSVSISIKQIENIAENLKQTSVNFKEAIEKANFDNEKGAEMQKEKYKELNDKINKISEKLDQETIVKDARKWENSKSQIISWVINVILLIVATALGISKFL